MHIHLTLKNWRSIAHAEIDLGPFTLLVGRNSTGKSNIVDALLFFYEIARDAELAVSRRGGIESIRRWSPTKPFQITIAITASDGKIRNDSDHVSHEIVLASGKDGAWRFKEERILAVRNAETLAEVTRAKLAAESIDLPPTSSAMTLKRLAFYPRFGSRGAKFPTVRSLRPQPELMRRPQPPHESLRLLESAENITTVLHRMKGEERLRITSVMKRIIPGLVAIQVESAGRYLALSFEQRQSRKTKASFVATEMSDGALRALAIVTAAAQLRRQELLVIEELEANLHPGAAEVVYDALHAASMRGSVLVTTHSPDILDRASTEQILVCDYVDGVTRVGPLDAAQRDLVKEGLFSVAEIMRSDDLRREGAEPLIVRDED